MSTDTMSTSSSFPEIRGVCPKPFYQEDTFPPTGGYVSGRFCMPIAALGNFSCCLPCPMTDWVYPEGFEQRTEIANWVNIATLILTLFLLLSFIALPVKWTHRHYLGVCLACSVGFIELGFLVPLAAKPDHCYNAITPNDMRSNLTCAFSGAFLVFGGWAAVLWVLLRALSLHLQVCWEIELGRKFFYSALLAGWGLPAVGLALTMSLTGVSYRFGNVCHVNHKDGIQDLWGPLLVCGAAALILQLYTLGYCVKVYVKNLMNDEATTETGSNVRSFTATSRTASARQTYRRVKRIIQLQWRGIFVVLLILADVVFFSVVFIQTDNSSQVTPDLLSRATPWLACLVFSSGDKKQCLPKAKGLATKESTILAVLIVFGMSGFWNLVFLGRWSMVLGWIDLIKRRLIKRQEFVSADARCLPNDPRTYEMLDSKSGPYTNIREPKPIASSPYTPDFHAKSDYYEPGSKTYVTPVTSFSTPRPPTSPDVRAWDPSYSYARNDGFSRIALSKGLNV